MVCLLARYTALVQEHVAVGVAVALVKAQAREEDYAIFLKFQTASVNGANILVDNSYNGANIFVDNSYKPTCFHRF